MKFKKSTEQKINKPLPKKKNWKLRAYLAFGIFMFIFFSFFVYILKEYIDTHTFKFQSPITFQKPLEVDRLQIISPMASPSARTIIDAPQAYAEEVEVKVWDSELKETVMSHFDEYEKDALEELLQRESSWNPLAVNTSSGACGLFQALPCLKMGCELTDVDCQAKWGNKYIESRYGDANKALEFWDMKKATTGSGWY